MSVRVAIASTWSAWGWDAPTVAVILGMAWFIIWESWAIFTNQPQHTWTWHIRPFFQSHPLLWLLAFATWVWLGLHFLFPRLEKLLGTLIRGG